MSYQGSKAELNRRVADVNYHRDASCGEIVRRGEGDSPNYCRKNMDLANLDLRIQRGNICVQERRSVARWHDAFFQHWNTFLSSLSPRDRTDLGIMQSRDSSHRRAIDFSRQMLDNCTQLRRVKGALADLDNSLVQHSTAGCPGAEPDLTLAHAFTSLQTILRCRQALIAKEAIYRNFFETVLPPLRDDFENTGFLGDVDSREHDRSVSNANLDRVGLYLQSFKLQLIIAPIRYLDQTVCQVDIIPATGNVQFPPLDVNIAQNAPNIIKFLGKLEYIRDRLSRKIGLYDLHDNIWRQSLPLINDDHLNREMTRINTMIQNHRNIHLPRFIQVIGQIRTILPQYIQQHSNFIRGLPHPPQPPIADTHLVNEFVSALNDRINAFEHFFKVWEPYLEIVGFNISELDAEYDFMNRELDDLLEGIYEQTRAF